MDNLFYFLCVTLTKINRSFQSSWFTKFTWLEYSVLEDKAYCFACRFFAPPSAKETAFISQGFHDWKHAFGMLSIMHG